MLTHTKTSRTYISIFVIDTIFHSEITKQNIHSTFIINRINPHTGEILETTDSLNTGVLRDAMASEIIPIRIDGSEGVQVLLVSPYRAIFRKMIFILALSALLAVFVWYAIFFLLRSFIHEKRLRQFQTDFSHALVHNMRTPLGTIAQINNLMTHDKMVADAEKRNKNIAIAQQEIINLQALTDRILTIARGEESRLLPTYQSINVTQEIRCMAATYSMQSHKTVTISTLFLPEHILFNADREMFTNAIRNLIDNAVKYSDSVVQITIDCRLSEEGLLISIQDNGYGIAKKDQKNIFDKFERGAAITRQATKGFGLGLAYVKSVVNAHGGTINLYSAKGKGATFELFFPIFGPDTPFPIQYNTKKS